MKELSIFKAITTGGFRFMFISVVVIWADATLNIFWQDSL